MTESAVHTVRYIIQDIEERTGKRPTDIYVVLPLYQKLLDELREYYFSRPSNDVGPLRFLGVEIRVMGEMTL